MDGGIGHDQIGTHGGVGVVRPVGLGQLGHGGQAGVGFDDHMGLEPVLTPLPGLVRMPGIRATVEIIRSGAVARAIRHRPSVAGPLSLFHVLPGHQRQQGDRLGRFPRPPSHLFHIEGVLGEAISPTRAVTNPACGFVVPRDPRLPGRGGVLPRHRGQPDALGSDQVLASARRRPADRGDQLVTVSWRATASSARVESRARRCLPANAPVWVMTSRTTSKIRCGRSLAANRFRQ